MIKYNLNNIDDWYFNTSDIIKVYRNNAVCYYKITGGGDTPTAQTPCFAVVDDISQYSDTEFEDVFNKADNKWYKLNNLNQYEEYGIYGSGRTITTYDGKLTIDTESIPQPSRLPQGYTEVEYIENTGTTSSNGAYLNLGLPLYNTIGNSFVITSRLKSEYYSASGYDDLETIINSESVSSPYYGFVYRYAHSNHNIQLVSNPSNHATLSTTANTDGTTSITISCNSTTVTDQVPLGLFASYNANYNTPYRFAKATIYSLTVVKNGDTVRDLVPAKRDSDSKYGLYDLVTDTFYLSPNNVDFSGGSEVIPPPITATCEFMYSGGSWVNVGEVSGSTATLPNKSFVLNYNAKDYDDTTHSIPYTSGQSKAINAIQNYGTNTIVDHSSDGYISVTANTRLTISGGTSLNRTNTETGCTMTIVSKARTDDVSNSYSILTNRGSYGDMNWMWRYPSNGIFLHGSSSYNRVTYYTPTSASPITASVRVSWNGSVQQQLNDWTNNGSYSGAFQYGSNSDSGSLFCDYAQVNNEFWKGDFYWVYMSQEVLTDEEIQQVIDYNEVGGGQPIYPLEYVVREDPPNNLVFSSMTEAESYECPWVGMSATIDGDKYIFSGDSISGYEWVYNPSRLPQGYTEVEYIENTSTAYIDTGAYLNTSNFEVGYTFWGNRAQWGYVHQNVANGAWVTAVNDYAYMGRYNSSYRVAISSYLTSDENAIVYTQSGVTVNGTSISKNLNLSGTDNLNASTLLFFVWYDFYKARVEHSFNSKVKSFYLKNNGILVRDFVPAKRDSDNKYGMYDLITDTFYLSPNNVDFSGGNPV